MNREIKFRVWDKKKMIENVGVMPILSFSDADKLTVPYSGDYFRPDRHILMQFTGLKDKNGREIYEGDVVRAWESETETTTGELRMTIDDAFNCYASLRDMYLDKTNLEIIGDIYSNPELLKHDKNS